MINVELLKNIPESELKHWAKINGYDDSWFDAIYAQWLIVNPEGVQKSVESTTE